MSDINDFKKGDRVKFNLEAAYWNVRHKERLGTVQHVNLWNSSVRVLWDGRKTPESYYPRFLAKHDDRREHGVINKWGVETERTNE